MDLPELPDLHRVDTLGGPVHVLWEADSEVTAHGSLTYFLEFLHKYGLWKTWVGDCPLFNTDSIFLKLVTRDGGTKDLLWYILSTSI